MVGIDFDRPGPFQHRIDKMLAPGNADHDARRAIGRPHGQIIVEPALEPP
jgi:hypothetical protein